MSVPPETLSRQRDLDRIIAFLESKGIAVVEGVVPPTALLPGVDLRDGGLVYDGSKLTWPGDLLHEAGHLAVVPPALRNSLGGKLGEDVMAENAGEVEATAWAWAAVVAIGLDPEVLFHEGGYQGRSKSLAFSYSCGSYPGSAGLHRNGMTLTFEEAQRLGRLPYPHMVRWLRE